MEARTARRSRIKDEVVAVFETAADRDLVQSYAPNLKGAKGVAGIRLDIPEHLMSVFKLLETHANGIRSRYKEGVKRSIRFDDIDRSLYMDMKLSGSGIWHRIGPSQVRESRKIQERAELAQVRGLTARHHTETDPDGTRALCFVGPATGHRPDRNRHRAAVGEREKKSAVIDISRESPQSLRTGEVICEDVFNSPVEMDAGDPTNSLFATRPTSSISDIE